jgi:hypothetical protein
MRHVKNLLNGHQAKVNAIAKNILNCGNNKSTHATWGMIEQEHTIMVSLSMHKPAFGKKK